MGKEEGKGPEKIKQKDKMRMGKERKVTLLHTRVVVGGDSPNFPPPMDSKDDEIE